MLRFLLKPSSFLIPPHDWFAIYYNPEYSDNVTAQMLSN